MTSCALKICLKIYIPKLECECSWFHIIYPINTILEQETWISHPSSHCPRRHSYSSICCTMRASILFKQRNWYQPTIWARLWLNGSITALKIPPPLWTPWFYVWPARYWEGVRGHRCTSLNISRDASYWWYWGLRIFGWGILWTVISTLFYFIPLSTALRSEILRKSEGSRTWGNVTWHLLERIDFRHSSMLPVHSYFWYHCVGNK